MENLKVILLRKVAGLGTIGDVVGVKPGFARNYLLPKKIAMRATVENIKQFETCRVQIEENNAKTRAEAEKVAEEMNGLVVVLVRQSSEKGHLYGSVTARDIAVTVSDAGFATTAGQINLHNPIKLLGVYEVAVDLHPEVSVYVRLSVAKSEEEARQQIAELDAKNQKKVVEPWKTEINYAGADVEEDGEDLQAFVDESAAVVEDEATAAADAESAAAADNAGAE
jgi:large subunit ribosomal protein L9